MERIIINTTSYSQIVKTNTILYAKAEGSYTRLVVTNGRDILLSRNLSWLENAIASSLFVRLHRSYLVNLDYVSYVFQGEGKVSLTNGSHIPYSRYKSKELVKALQSLFCGESVAV